MVAPFPAASVLAAAVLLLFGAAGCGEAHVAPVPDVTGQHLAVAEDTLDDYGLRLEAIGGGVVGIVVRSHWLVCRQAPPAGTRATIVTLVVDRSCPDDLRTLSHPS
jgi:hypothetical protein